MKVQNRRLSFMSLFLASVLTAGQVQTAHAQDLLDETDDLLQDGSAMQMDDINIDGKLSPSEQLRKRREKLEERNKLMVEKKIEDIRVKQEIALTNKLNTAFTKGLNNLNEDKVEVKQAAPVAPQPVVQVAAPVVQPVIVETKVEAKEVEKVEKNSRVIPYIGGQSIKGTNGLDLESKLNIGLNLETKLQSNITMGLGVGYTSLNATDTANTYSSTTYYCSTGTCSAREMSYSKFNVEANGKFFFTVDSKVKPYIGAAVLFNRSNLKYDTAATYYYNTSTTLGNEGYSTNYFSAQAKLGAEIDFNDNIGFNLDLAYSKALTSGIGSNSDTSSSTNPDQGRLENVSSQIEKADVTSFGAGVVIKF